MSNQIHIQAAELLVQIIAIPSHSREEEQVCNFLQDWFESNEYNVKRKHNNLWLTSVINKDLPTILLNSHLDTVQPSSDWTMDPYLPEIRDGKIFGLGSNDAGASVVSLIFTFLELEKLTGRSYNLILALTSEEEISGANGISSVLDEMGGIDLAIVGEPTGMKMAICERGLIVLDCYAKGKAGHAAHRTGENAILKAINDIRVIEEMKFEKISEFLGEVSMNVTQIAGGTHHNVIPDQCKFVIDVRSNEFYSNEDLVDIIQANIQAEVVPRSLRLSSSFLDPDHPLVQLAKIKGIEVTGSATLSDQALIPGPSVKIGPGDTHRSHQAEEFIYIDEIKQGISLYVNLLKEFSFYKDETLG